MPCHTCGPPVPQLLSPRLGCREVAKSVREGLELDSSLLILRQALRCFPLSYFQDSGLGYGNQSPWSHAGEDHDEGQPLLPTVLQTLGVLLTLQSQW